jgi:hypothetical protein
MLDLGFVRKCVLPSAWNRNSIANEASFQHLCACDGYGCTIPVIEQCSGVTPVSYRARVLGSIRVVVESEGREGVRRMAGLFLTDQRS